MHTGHETDVLQALQSFSKHFWLFLTRSIKNAHAGEFGYKLSTGLGEWKPSYYLILSWCWSSPTQSQSAFLPPSILFHHQTFGVCERSARPVLESANYQRRYMFVVPLWWFLSGGFGLSKPIPHPLPPFIPLLDFAFARGLCKMLSLVSNIPWVSFSFITSLHDVT